MYNIPRFSSRSWRTVKWNVIDLLLCVNRPKLKIDANAQASSAIPNDLPRFYLNELFFSLARYSNANTVRLTAKCVELNKIHSKCDISKYIEIALFNGAYMLWSWLIFSFRFGALKKSKKRNLIRSIFQSIAAFSHLTMAFCHVEHFQFALYRAAQLTARRRYTVEQLTVGFFFMNETGILVSAVSNGIDSG